MAPMLFAEAIFEGRPIQVFNHGRHSRDFTYVDDIVEGVIRACDRIAEPDPDWDPADPDPATSNAPYRIYNIGNNAPVRLADFIAALEAALGRAAIKELLPLQPGDVPDTYRRQFAAGAGGQLPPGHPGRRGVRRFVAWYRDYYGPPQERPEGSPVSRWPTPRGARAALHAFHREIWFKQLILFNNRK